VAGHASPDALEDEAAWTINNKSPNLYKIVLGRAAA
jgi:hypothetical protein